MDQAYPGRQLQAGKEPEEWVVAGGRRRGGARGERRGLRFASRLGVQRPWGIGEMAARSLGCGIGRLLGSLPGRAGARGWPLGVSALRKVASGPPGSAPAAVQPASYPTLRVQAARQPAAFWGPLARDTLVWDTPFHTVWDCDFSSGKIGWFLGGQLNVSGEWAAGTQGTSNSRVHRGLSTWPAQRSGADRRPEGHGTPAHVLQGSRGNNLHASCNPRLDPIFPGDPAQRQLESPSCWPWPSSLLQWQALTFKHGIPPPPGAPGDTWASVEGAGRPIVGTYLLLSRGPEAKLKSIWPM